MRLLPPGLPRFGSRQLARSKRITRLLRTRDHPASGRHADEHSWNLRRERVSFPTRLSRDPRSVRSRYRGRRLNWRNMCLPLFVSQLRDQVGSVIIQPSRAKSDAVWQCRLEQARGVSIPSSLRAQQQQSTTTSSRRYIETTFVVSSWTKRVRVHKFVAAHVVSHRPLRPLAE